MVTLVEHPRLVRYVRLAIAGYSLVALAGMLLRQRPLVEMSVMSILLTALFAAAVLDLRCLKSPNSVVYPAIFATGTLRFSQGVFAGFAPLSGSPGFMLGLLVLMVATMFFFFGGGDAKLAVLISLALSPTVAVCALLLGYFSSLTLAVVKMIATVRHPQTWPTALAMAPHMATGTVIATVYSNLIVTMLFPVLQ
ncbi:MAG: hypothetical protein R3C28_26700 [Pirellulaceae bacterium]